MAFGEKLINSELLQSKTVLLACDVNGAVQLFFGTAVFKHALNNRNVFFNHSGQRASIAAYMVMIETVLFPKLVIGEPSVLERYKIDCAHYSSVSDTESTR